MSRNVRVTRQKGEVRFTTLEAMVIWLVLCPLAGIGAVSVVERIAREWLR
jgi:hypothetical protein